MPNVRFMLGGGLTVDANAYAWRVSLNSHGQCQSVPSRKVCKNEPLSKLVAGDWEIIIRSDNPAIDQFRLRGTKYRVLGGVRIHGIAIATQIRL